MKKHQNQITLTEIIIVLICTFMLLASALRGVLKEQQ